MYFMILQDQSSSKKNQNHKYRKDFYYNKKEKMHVISLE